MGSRYTVSITTIADGSATAYVGPVNGAVSAILYDGGMATGADITFTGEETGTPIHTWTNAGTSAVTVAPRQPTHDLVGAASLYAAGGEGVEDKIYIFNERIKIVVAQGGNVDTGVFNVTII